MGVLRTVVGAVLIGLLASMVPSLGCGLPRPRGPVPLYDYDTVWFNDEVGGLRPWHPRDRGAVVRAARARERRWRKARATGRAVADSGGGSEGSERAAADGGGGSEGSERAVADGGGAEAGGSGESSGRAGRDEGGPADEATEGEATASASADEAGTADGGATAERHAEAAEAAGQDASGPDEAPAAAIGHDGEGGEAPLLGDGSVRSEVLAAARRLVGVQGGFGQRGFLAHVLRSAAVDVASSGPAARYERAVWRRMRELERVDAGRPPRPGDLALFGVPAEAGPELATAEGARDPPPGDGFVLVAVVERVKPSGVLVCIGRVHGRVRRFAADPDRPRVRRDETSGVRANTPIRPRRLDDAPGQPTLAGALFGGYARLGEG